jgi:hypothetical protein
MKELIKAIKEAVASIEKEKLKARIQYGRKTKKVSA